MLTLAIPTIGTINYRAVESMLEATGSGLITAINIVPRLPIHQARTRLVNTTNSSFILFADDDMIYGKREIQLLLAHALQGKPVVSGLVNRRSDKSSVPVVYKFGEKGYELTEDFDKENVSQVDGVTLAFTIINMSVFDKVGKTFRFTDTLGEDLEFNLRLRKAGIPVFLEPRAKVGHLTEKVL